MKKRTNNKGFTLIETILTVIVVGIIAGVTAKVLISGIDAYALVTSRKDAMQHARVGMDRMVAEMTTVSENDISTMANTNFVFVDTNSLNTSFTSATQYSNLVLARGSDLLAGPLGLLDFDYKKADGTSTVLPSELRLIDIELSIDTFGGYGSVTFRTEVFPRNYMYTGFQTN